MKISAKKTGLFFGSFNPIHIGHLIIASQLVEHSDLDEVWFVVSPQNPFKQHSSLLDRKHRLYMVNLSVENNYKLRSSDIEFHLPVPSYTIDTLVVLEEKYPGREFALIMGSDNLKSFQKWKNPEQILKRCELYVYPRPGFELSPEWKSHDRLKYFEVPLLDISASFIRQCIKESRSIQYLVTEKVREHIEDMHFYEKNQSN